ncbi:nicotinate-nucleotide adenylyltransferase [Undibacterium sp. Jales W-56]|uniref:nicotinate-nucleotide adenylyltransferase n=1 Tax=Undibacterium sp. Jales W-56 TaxID=2897325 RepID=UPI0021CE987A|nr:nicotinate-nucleotide adenylyltransferase [Undibacterium sp. Jales W-56]MCU6435773.1 nicotinate-nucleotide adenylyltransferase [Undibacterium sp. Jales W-56]
MSSPSDSVATSAQTNPPAQHEQRDSYSEDSQAQQCIVVLGGSFDPVHLGHLALAKRFISLLYPQELRIIPAGNPWQKKGLIASAAQRCAMLELAFAAQFDCKLTIDLQEIQRAEQQQATYTIDTLRALRAEYGDQTSIVFLIGADQLQNLSNWHQWQDLFGLAHICAASRPGFQLDQTNSPQTAMSVAQQVQQQVLQKFKQGAATPEQIRTTPAGRTYLAEDLLVDISATQIRDDLQRGQLTTSLVPPKVLDYLQQHHIYEK